MITNERDFVNMFSGPSKQSITFKSRIPFDCKDLSFLTNSTSPIEIGPAILEISLNTQTDKYVILVCVSYVYYK